MESNSINKPIPQYETRSSNYHLAVIARKHTWSKFTIYAMFIVVGNKDVIVNKSGHHLELLLADQLKKILADVSWLRSWQVEVESLTPDARWDLIASGPLPNGTPGQWNVECRPQMVPSQFDALMKRARECQKSQGVPVLAVPRISPRLADLCQQNGWSWYDLAGNCHLELPPFLFIERTGLEPVELASQKSSASLASPEAGQVIRALLAPAHAGRRWTQRQVVEVLHKTSPHLAPSLALVNKVVQAMRAEAYLESLPDRGFRVADPAGLKSIHARPHFVSSCQDALAKLRYLKAFWRLP